MPDRFTEIAVRTKAQTNILTELHETHHRVRRILAKIEHEARRATDTGWFDTPFLLNPCHELATAVAEERTLKQAAKLAGCSREEILSACVPGHVIVEVLVDAEIVETA
jgi:hypothetical protein